METSPEIGILLKGDGHMQNGTANAARSPKKLLNLCSAGIVMSLFLCNPACLAPHCRSDVIKTTVSPGGTYSVHVVEADCGATTRFMSSVQVERTTPRFGLGMLGRPKEKVFGAEVRATRLRLYWQSDSHLLVECSNCSESEIAFHQPQWESLNIILSTKKAQEVQ
jgi:hypothetical protein